MVNNNLWARLHRNEMIYIFESEDGRNGKVFYIINESASHSWGIHKIGQSVKLNSKRERPTKKIEFHEFIALKLRG